MTTDDRWLGWHLSDGTLRYGDSRRIVAGETHTVEGPLKLCESGLHASAWPLDAVYYGRGTQMARVELVGERIDDEDKSVAREHRYLAVADVGPILHEFACCCAEGALLLANVDDPRCWQAIEAKRAWLRGEIDAQALAAARDAARDAARVATEDAARAAARAAARDAARAAACVAACVAAWGAARDAAWDEMNDLLESMLWESGLFEEAR